MGGGIGATIWDAGLVLSKYFEANNKALIRDKSVLEIGSGTGLVGMVCAKLGAKSVLFTDKDCAMPLLNKNLFENFYKYYSVKLQKEEEDNQTLLLSHELTWGDDKQMKSLCDFMLKHFGKIVGMFDVIILSDCICWKELHKPLIGALQSIVNFIAKHNKNRIPLIIMSYEIRKEKEEQNFFELLTKIKWKYKRLELKGVDLMWICDELPVYIIYPEVGLKQ